MPKWEYCQMMWIERIVSAEEGEKLAAGLSSQGVEVAFSQVDGVTLAQAGYLTYFYAAKERKIEEVKDFGRTLAKLGLDGWELVSHSQIDTPALMEAFYFRRPIEE